MALRQRELLALQQWQQRAPEQPFRRQLVGHSLGAAVLLRALVLMVVVVVLLLRLLLKGPP